MAHKLFVNLAVKDVERSIEFFRALGFNFNPKFTDKNAGCMLIGEDAYAMLLAEPFFKGFTKREICDTSTRTEALMCLMCDTKEAVDQMVEKALEMGGQPAMDKKDYGFMYGWSFYDLDGHHWEVGWMDPVAAANGPGGGEATETK